MAIIASNQDLLKTSTQGNTKTATQTKTTTSSSNSDIVKLQQALIRSGYDVGKSGADGVYGKDTAAAVMQYQKDNGLNVTGIADKNTTTVLYGNENANPNNAVSALKTVASNIVNQGVKTATDTAKQKAATTTANNSSSSSSTGGSKKTTTTTAATTQPAKEVEPFSYADFSYADYAQSDVVKQALDLLNQQEALKPGDYQSQWQDYINDYMSQIENRDPFSYDPNSDALYQMYKDNYIQQGQMAMMDTMGQAAAMTGGYGNSYAQTVGQQSYNQQLNQLNNILPELYQMSYNQYQDEGQRLQDMYNMYLGREEMDYGRYMDTLNAWQAERDYLAGRYDTEREFDYNKYYQDRNLAYDEWSSSRDQAFNDYWNTVNMDYQKQRDAVTDAQWQAEFDRKSSSGSGGGSSTPSYSKMDLDSVRTNFKRLDSAEEIQYYADQLAAEGYNPDTIWSLEQQALASLANSTPLPTGVGNTYTPTQREAAQAKLDEDKKKQQQSGGGGGLKSVVERFTY